MQISEIIAAINEYAPFSYQESWDNSGIQIGEPGQKVNRGLICLDVTESIVEEAMQKNCDVIISHHPLLFGGIKSLTGKHYTERIVMQAIQNNISIISVHTNLDFVKQGVNKKLSDILGLQKLQVLDPKAGELKKLVVFCPNDHGEAVRKALFAAGAGAIGDYDCCSYNLEGRGSFRAGQESDPFVGEKGEIHFEEEVRIETVLPAALLPKVIPAMIKAHPYEEVAYDIYPLENTFDQAGSGMLGHLESAMSEKDFLSLLKHKLGSVGIRHSDFTGKKVQKVALCGGSGSFLKQKAKQKKADVFVTADLKYHDFFEADSKILLVDVGHYESEQFTNDILYEILSKKISNFALLISETNTNPVNYF